MAERDESDIDGISEVHVRFAKPEADGVAQEQSSPETAVARVGDPVTVWPCANCGRPVPQPTGSVRTIRYCQDNEGVCAREARNRRERGRDAPGLTGQVAWTWELVERLEKMADGLADSLTAELSVAGVERRIADIKAESARDLAIAQNERDASQRQAEEAWQEAANVRTRAEVAERDAAAAREETKLATAKRDAAQQAWEEAHQMAQQASTAQLAADSERDRVAAREAELLAALESSRAELVTLHSKLAESDAAVESLRAESGAVKQGSEDLRTALREAETQRRQSGETAAKAEAERTVALRAQAEAEAELLRANARCTEALSERDNAVIQAQQAIGEREKFSRQVDDQVTQARQLSQTVAELQAALSALAEERDAARAEADRARRQIDHLTHNGLSSSVVPAGRPPGGPGGSGGPGGQPPLSAPPMPPGQHAPSQGGPHAPSPGGPSQGGPYAPSPGGPSQSGPYAAPSQGGQPGQNAPAQPGQYPPSHNRPATGPQPQRAPQQPGTPHSNGHPGRDDPLFARP